MTLRRNLVYRVLNSCSVETWGFEATLGLRNSWFLQNMSLDHAVAQGDCLYTAFALLCKGCAYSQNQSQRCQHGPDGCGYAFWSAKASNDASATAVGVTLPQRAMQ